MTRVNPGSLPHHCRMSSRAAAVQRVWPVTTCTASPGWTWLATASSRETTGVLIAFFVRRPPGRDRSGGRLQRRAGLGDRLRCVSTLTR